MAKVFHRRSSYLPFSYLPVLFMAPAVVVVVLFFFVPAVMTGLFAFTDMSTATGIKGRDYLVNQDSLRQLSTAGLSPPALARLSGAGYRVDAEGLEKFAQSFGPTAARALEETLQGAVFNTRRDLEKALKKLGKNPELGVLRKTRARKRATDFFKRSVLGVRFASAQALRGRLADLGIHGAEADLVTEAAYTGWNWTTETIALLFSLPSVADYALNSLLYVVLTLAFNVFFGLFLALSTFYLSAGQAAFFRTIWFLPRILPPVLYVLMWKWLTWDTGFLATLLTPSGAMAKNWMMASSTHAWTVIVLMNGFVGASMGMILFTSALKAIPATLLHAAAVDGAGRLQQIRFIILPQLRWPILFVTSYQTLSLLTSFEYIFLSTDGGPGSSTEVWALAAYHFALNNDGGNLQYALGAAFALVLVAVGVVAALFSLRLFNFRELVADPKIEGQG